METVVWVVLAAGFYLALSTLRTLRSIDGSLRAIKGLLSSDGPDPGYTSYQRMTAGSLSAIKAMLDREDARRTGS